MYFKSTSWTDLHFIKIKINEPDKKYVPLLETLTN